MIPDVEGTRPWGSPKKRIPKCLKGPKTTYTTIAIAEKHSKRSKKVPFCYILGPPWSHPGNGIYEARRGRSLPVPPPPPGFSGHDAMVIGFEPTVWTDGLRESIYFGQQKSVGPTRFFFVDCEKGRNPWLPLGIALKNLFLAFCENVDTISPQIRSRGFRKRFLGWVTWLDLVTWFEVTWSHNVHKMCWTNVLKAIPKTAAPCPALFPQQK